MAHEGTGEAKIEVEPSSLTAGDTVVLAGSGLEPDSDRVLVLAGEGLTVEFGTVKTDAEGMFSKELTIPSHLPSGNYELRAIGDETLTTPLAVTAAAGEAQASPAANAAGETVVARERSSVELARSSSSSCSLRAWGHSWSGALSGSGDRHPPDLFLAEATAARSS